MHSRGEEGGGAAGELLGFRACGAACGVPGKARGLHGHMGTVDAGIHPLQRFQVDSEFRCGGVRSAPGLLEDRRCSNLSGKSPVLQRQTASILGAGLLRKGVLKTTTTKCPGPSRLRPPPLSPPNPTQTPGHPVSSQFLCSNGAKMHQKKKNLSGRVWSLRL